MEQKLHIFLNIKRFVLAGEDNMNPYINILKQIDIFYGFSDTQLALVADLYKETTYNEDEIIFHEGADSNELYIIVQGMVNIQVDPTLIHPHNDFKDLVTIATLKRGQSFGEIALVDQGLRSATARTVTENTKFLMIERDRLMMLCNAYPKLGYHLMHNLAADLALKIRSTDLRIREELLYGRDDKKT
jgi:CRP/FNR family transcriptional regulator, cyclic AMP receptor protein